MSFRRFTRAVEGYPVNDSVAENGWIGLSHDSRADDFHQYAVRIAEARFAVRKVTRILDESARTHGLEPLQHQALLQIFGTNSGAVAVHELASRLDVVPAFASRLVKQLDMQGLIARESLASDKRVALLNVTNRGIELLQKIEVEVHHHMSYFQRGLSSEQHLATLSIFALFIGEPMTEAAKDLLG